MGRSVPSGLLARGSFGTGFERKFLAPFILCEQFVCRSDDVPFRFPGRVCCGIALPQDAVFRCSVCLAAMSKNRLDFVVVFSFYLVRRWPRVVFSVFVSLPTIRDARQDHLRPWSAVRFSRHAGGTPSRRSRTTNVNGLPSSNRWPNGTSQPVTRGIPTDLLREQSGQMVRDAHGRRIRSQLPRTFYHQDVAILRHDGVQPPSVPTCNGDI